MGDGIGLGISLTALTSALLPWLRGSSRTQRCRRRLYVALNVECAPFSMTSVTMVGYCWRSSALDDAADDDEGLGDWLPICGDDEVDPVCELNSTRNLADLAGPTEDDSAVRQRRQGQLVSDSHVTDHARRDAPRRSVMRHLSMAMPSAFCTTTETPIDSSRRLHSSRVGCA